MAKIFQFGILPAFLNGLYKGDISFESIQKKGNFGLGTINGLKGELLAVDGEFYQMDENGKATKVNPKNATPFALVSQFQADKIVELQQIESIQNLYQKILSQMQTLNIFYMFRIDGCFKNLYIRSENCQFSTNKPLGELLPAIQEKQTLKYAQGTLVGSFCPAYSQGITLEKFHFHFINQERTLGGHVFDLMIERAQLQIQNIHEFELHVFRTNEFYQFELELDDESVLKKIESS